MRTRLWRVTSNAATQHSVVVADDVATRWCSNDWVVILLSVTFQLPIFTFFSHLNFTVCTNNPSQQPHYTHCRLLLHDTVKRRRFRSGTSASPISWCNIARILVGTTVICDCGSQTKTAEYFLLHCCIYQEHRDDMIYQRQQICYTKHNKSILTSYRLLLLPHEDNSANIQMQWSKTSPSSYRSHRIQNPSSFHFLSPSAFQIKLK